jgi:sulfite reductase alpha subunit-like flavoprotein
MVECDPSIDLYILYASATGTCQEISQIFEQSIKETAISAQIKNIEMPVKNVRRMTMNDYKQAKLTDKNTIKVLIMFASSTGDGDCPENGLNFRCWLEQ